MEPQDLAGTRPTAGFATTHWSLVVAAGQGDTSQAQAALESLCRSYWYPIYAFIRHRGHAPDEARYLTQEFFARMLARNGLNRADAARGRFRAFLLASVRHFLSDDWDKRRAEKRRTSLLAIPFDELGTWNRAPPTRLGRHLRMSFTNRIGRAPFLTHTCRRLREEYAKAGRTDRFQDLNSSCRKAPATRPMPKSQSDWG